MRVVRTACAVAVGLGVLATGASAQSISDRMNQWLFGGYSTPPSGSNPNTAAEVDCPGVDVRQGASTLAISAPGTETGPMTMRYQVSIAQTARECAALGGVMTMKVGIQGRVLLGPTGGPGQIDIPLRMAVVQEGAAPKTIVTRFYRLAVAVPPGQVNVPFVHVEQDLTFPLPRGAELDAYVVYVGFDPASLNQKPERKPPAKRAKQAKQK
jgi:hypothetical protein